MKYDLEYLHVLLYYKNLSTLSNCKALFFASITCIWKDENTCHFIEECLPCIKFNFIALLWTLCHGIIFTLLGLASGYAPWRPHYPQPTAPPPHHSYGMFVKNTLYILKTCYYNRSCWTDSRVCTSIVLK